jgi:hypothetical protein
MADRKSSELIHGKGGRISQPAFCGIAKARRPYSRNMLIFFTNAKANDVDP